MLDQSKLSNSRFKFFDQSESCFLIFIIPANQNRVFSGPIKTLESFGHFVRENQSAKIRDFTEVEYYAR